MSFNKSGIINLFLQIGDHRVVPFYVADMEDKIMFFRMVQEFFPVVNGSRQGLLYQNMFPHIEEERYLLIVKVCGHCNTQAVNGICQAFE